MIEAIERWSQAEDWRSWIAHALVWDGYQLTGLLVSAILLLLLAQISVTRQPLRPLQHLVLALGFVPTLGGYIWGFHFYERRERKHLSAAWQERDIRRIVDSVLDLLLPWLWNTGVLAGFGWFYYWLAGLV